MVPHLLPISQLRFNSGSTNPRPAAGSAPKAESPADAQSAAEAKPAQPAAEAGSGPLAWWIKNKNKLKELASRYGWFPVATYLGIYVVVLSGIYVLVKVRAVQGPDAEGINKFVNNWFIKRAILGDRVVTIPPGIVDFATAWVLTKTTEPVRLVATIAVVPGLARRVPAHILARFGAKVAEKAAKA